MDQSHRGNMLSTQEIVKKYNLSYQTVNYYTNLGLFEVTKRKGNGRLYSADHIQKRLQKITKLKNEGYPLRLICKFIGEA